MLRRKSTAYQELDRLFPQLDTAEQLCALWESLMWLQEIAEFTPLGHTSKVMRAESLMSELSDEEYEGFVSKYEEALSRPIKMAADSLITDEEQKFPDKLLVATWLMPDRKIRSRALSQFFSGYNVSASNLSATLDQLEKQELIELQPLVEGREKEFTLTAAGRDRRKRILKKLAQTPSP